MSRKSRLRDCPAVGRAIEAFECGSGRHHVYACPESCCHNPFSSANYATYGPIEGAAETAFFNWLIKHTPNPAEFDAVISRTLGPSPRSDYFHALAWQGIYRRNADGETCIGRWAKEGFPGLSKDQQLVARAKVQTRPAIVEVQRVIDDKRLEVLDLLDPKKVRFILVDRVLARHAVRFSVYAVHAFRLPHFDRLFGAARMIPSLPPLPPEEIVSELIRHLGGGTEEQAMREWLMEHYPLFEEALLALGLARRKSMFENIDGQFGKAVYQVVRPFEDCKELLRAVPKIGEDTIEVSEKAEGFVEARAWFAEPGDPEIEIVGEGAALGRILLGRAHWRLEAMGGSRLDRLRFESLMGDYVRFAGERRDDLAAQLRLQDPPYNAGLVPQTLLRDPQQLATAMARVPAPEGPEATQQLVADHYLQRDVRFLDEKIHALKGHTPRQAASDPSLRPELIRLMKERVHDCDTRNLETGRADDVNWMLRELGLNEILFSPPPQRPPLQSEPDFEEA